MTKEMSFKDKYKYARTVLGTSSPFFGHLVMQLPCDEVSRDSALGPTAWTDGKTVKFNEDFTAMLTREEFTGVLLHEILHVALAHIPRMQMMNYNPRKHNIATDYVINLLVKEAEEESNRTAAKTRIKLPELPGMCYEEKYAGWGSDAIYASLPDDENDGSGQGDANAPGNGGISGDLMVEQASPHDASQISQDMKNAITAAAQSAKMQGKLPAGIERELNDLLYPKVDWRILLQRFIQSHPDDFDFNMRDRRHMDSEFFFPEFSGERIAIAICADTSGSISSEELDFFYTETFGILKEFGRADIYAMSCDAAVHTAEYISSVEELANLKLRGGGGTDFRPVFNHLDENDIKPSALIYLTDGFGSYPDASEAPSYPTIWLMTTDFPEENVPFGDIIRY